MVRIRRVYDAVDSADGFRVLVDRLWPRGVSRERAKLDLWLKEIAPSDELRRWFRHDPTNWDEFRNCYLLELKSHETDIRRLQEIASGQNLTLLFAARDVEHNEAVVICDLINESTAT